ncbi:hypothetical protein A2690_00715 [Candidatus Roizmanbacteria bacterium RIFCSPHIGHO2_01_FULL_39_12b]|uniref:Uncharacterized protein n=1 Tax=Candidatus Roizmanbacteria bacterium RIFCSPHIGHO2_01_FULL_39_12b TaxID=1802030 RepID=A0A1F7GAM7_9BACT|nr:MAG: hypothetical protein A2690_00715 [Candidatus Roizmanbacteria bacterium RIFCSPHIGHO2_01_FULL_39_12b]
MPTNPIIAQTEKVFLQKLVELIETEAVSPIDGQTITKEFLKCVDLEDVAKFKEALNNLTLKYADFKPVYSEFLRLEEQNKVDNVLNKMQGLMQNNSNPLPVSEPTAAQIT